MAARRIEPAKKILLSLSPTCHAQVGELLQLLQREPGRMHMPSFSEAVERAVAEYHARLMRAVLDKSTAVPV